jgi:predicted MFS family arabinose efflux permease
MRKNSWTLIRYFAKNISVVIGFVMIWRGIWYVLDAVGGIVIGLLILYLPDKDPKEIEKRGKTKIFNVFQT